MEKSLACIHSQTIAILKNIFKYKSRLVLFQIFKSFCHLSSSRLVFFPLLFFSYLSTFPLHHHPFTYLEYHFWSSVICYISHSILFKPSFLWYIYISSESILASLSPFFDQEMIGPTSQKYIRVIILCDWNMK